MTNKLSPLQKNFGRIVIGLVFIVALFFIYILAVVYFEQCVLAEQKANESEKSRVNSVYPDGPLVSSENAIPENKTLAITEEAPLTQKISEKVNAFYSFFFDLSKTDAAYNPGRITGEKDKQTLYLGSFPYTTAIVDDEKTSLYFEGVSNSIIFPPDYNWDMAGQDLVAQNQAKFGAHANNTFDGPYNDKRCLNNDCVEYKDNKLFYNNKVVSFPSGIKAKDLKAISLGIVGQKWLIGFTLKDIGYRGEVFYFDGATFSQISNLPSISSTYFGLFGFGGEEDDFLIIYGSYQGQAFRVRGDKITNLDNFFGYRPMNNGFKSEIIRAESNNYVNWYIYSSTLDALRFIKLWEDKDGEISGEASLLYDLNIIGKSVEFQLIEAKSDKAVLLAKINSGTNTSWKVFTDKGFVNDKEKILVTLPITHDAESSEIFIKKIYESSLELDKDGQALVKVEFSVDGQKWQNISWGKDISFEQVATKHYFIRTVFSPPGNKFYSPAISNILFSYVCRI